MTNLNAVFLYPPGWRTVSALFVGALCLSLIFAPAAGRAAFKLGAVDHGGGRRVHTGSIPRLGGLGIFLSCLLVSAAYFLIAPGRPVSQDGGRILGLLAAASLIFFVGAYDDIKGLRVYKKLFFEILAGCILYHFGFRAGFLSNPFGGLDLSSLGLPLTVVWVLIVTNSINLVDGLDGLAACTGIFVAFTMFFVSGDPMTAAIAAVLTGSLTGFLFFNYPPARLFMGDSGSLFIGLVLAALSMTAGVKSAAAFGIMVPMTAFWFPLMDMVYAVLRRYYRGLPLGNADKEHIHHKLLEKGFSKRKVILLLSSINFLLMLSALALVRSRQPFSPALYFLFVSAAIIGGLRYLNYLEFRPFIDRVVGEHASARKRKYHLYLLRAFKRDVDKIGPGRADEIYGRIETLLAAMDFTSARIELGEGFSGRGRYVWFNQGKKSSSHVSLIFPIEHKGRIYGKVHLKRDIREGRLACAEDLIFALSSVQYPSLKDRNIYPPRRPAKAAERRPTPSSINFN